MEMADLLVVCIVEMADDCEGDQVMVLYKVWRQLTVGDSGGDIILHMYCDSGVKVNFFLMEIADVAVR